MKFYRIQPAGLSLNHKSEDSSGESLHLHVFDSIEATLNCEGVPSEYGDEVVEIEADNSWDNGDVEGVAINGHKAVIVNRFSLDQFAAIACPSVATLTADDLESVPVAYNGCELWFAARNPSHFSE